MRQFGSLPSSTSADEHNDNSTKSLGWARRLATTAARKTFTTFSNLAPKCGGGFVGQCHKNDRESTINNNNGGSVSARQEENRQYWVERMEELGVDIDEEGSLRTDYDLVRS